MAQWKAAFLPDWEWEAYDKNTEEDGLYFGRVRSPNTYGNWEYGYFSEDQLRTAGAYRTDVDPDEEPRFPDGGYLDDLSLVKLYETELEALLEYEGDPESTK